MLTALLIFGAFILGCTVGYFFCQSMYIAAGKQGKVFIKHKNKWYPYNPFRGKDA